MSVGNFNQIFEGREIAIHTIQAFDDDPHAPASALRSPATNGVFDQLRFVMASELTARSAGASSLMDTAVHKRIEDDQVASLRQRGQN